MYEGRVGIVEAHSDVTHMSMFSINNSSSPSSSSSSSW